MIQIKESPRYHLFKHNFSEAFLLLDNLRIDANLEKFDEKTKKEIKSQFLVGKVHKNDFSTLINETYLKISIPLWFLWFTASYIFYGVMYLIPELVGKSNTQNISFNELITAVVYSTIFEIFGIIATFIIENKNIGRIGSFRICFTLCLLLCIISLFSSLQLKGIILQIIKGVVQISARALFPYTTEIYPTEIRGTGLGIANVFARAAGILTPLSNEILKSYSTNMCFLAFVIASLVGTLFSYIQKKETLGINIE